MSRSINAPTFNVTIDAPAETVFDFARDLANLPRWAVNFCRGIRIEGDHAIVDSPSGPAYFRVDSDPSTGVIDWWSGPTKAQASRWPTRVVGFPDGRTLYLVTAILPSEGPGIPNLEQLFDEELGMLKRLVEARDSEMSHARLPESHVG